MSRPAFIPTSRAGPSPVAGSMVTRSVSRLVRALRAALAQERSLRQLDALDEHLRRDIGLSPHRPTRSIHDMW